MDDAWSTLRVHTAARIALGRCGSGLPTQPWLRFGVAHAQARDAVHAPLEVEALAQRLASLGIDSLPLASAAADRATYLRRPDLGRRLDDDSASRLSGANIAPGGLAIVLADGLSAAAVHAHAIDLLLELQPRLDAGGFALAPLLLARQARVALGDDIGERLRAQAVLMLIGERPGLSSPDSLGAYLSWAPRRGLSDAARNCVSNIRPAGLPPAHAAHTIAWLLQAARTLGQTGIALKDDSGSPALAASDARGRIAPAC